MFGSQNGNMYKKTVIMYIECNYIFIKTSCKMNFSYRNGLSRLKNDTKIVSNKNKDMLITLISNISNRL